MRPIGMWLLACIVVFPACSTNVPATLPGNPAHVDAAMPWSVRIAQSFILRHPGAVTYDSLSPAQGWNYEQGLMLVALYRMWRHTNERRYFDFVKNNIDRYVQEDGTIRTYSRTEYNLDNVAPGRVLLALYAETKDDRYRRAADTLRQQLREHPRTHEGGFWHKRIYPYQMWLDGLFMAEPFYAMFAVRFGDTGTYEDILHQFRYVTVHTKDPNTGLLYHGWDESKSQRWANPQTGCSPTFWSRAIGWYAMALVEVLDILPGDADGRRELVRMLQDVARAVAAVQDSASGLWWQVVDLPGREGNYFEASGSAMFAYALARGTHQGYLDRRYEENARRAFRGLTERLVTTEPSGFVNLEGTCKGAGLGGNPYRDGSYAYYIGEPRRANDLKGLGAFLLAAIELEQGGTLK
jgi:unsaturated rhamnogalacturonyl hydrolase